MTTEEWDDLSDGELMARLRNRGTSYDGALMLVEQRERSQGAREAITAILGGPVVVPASSEPYEVTDEDYFEEDEE